MTIVNTIISKTIFGNKRVHLGKSVLSGSVSTGEVVTGLAYTEMFVIENKNTGQKGSAIDETLPLSSGTITAHVETNDTTFYWMAIGR